MGGAGSSNNFGSAFGKVGSLVAELSHGGAHTVDDKILAQKLQHFAQLIRKDPVEFANFRKFLWTAGDDGQVRINLFFKRLFDLCIKCKSLETKQVFLELVLWLAEHKQHTEDDHQAMIEAGLANCLLDVLRYNATFYVEEMLMVITKLTMLFAQYEGFSKTFTEFRGDGMLCDALNTEKSMPIMLNVANTLYLLSEWRQLRLTAHSTQVPAIAKILQSAGAATVVGAHLILAMCTHPDIYEKNTNVEQLMMGKVMVPLVEALRTAAKAPAGRRPSGRGASEKDTFEIIIKVVSALIFGDKSPGKYHEGLMSDFIQCGGIDVCQEVVLAAIRTMMEPNPESVMLRNRVRAHTCIGLLALFSDSPHLLPEVLTREAPEAAILLYAMADFNNTMEAESAAASLRLLSNITASSHECRLRVVLHENSISLFEGLGQFRPGFTVHQLRLFCNIVVDEFLDEPVPFSDEVGTQMAVALGRIVTVLVQEEHGLNAVDRNEHLKLAFKLLQRICRKPGAANAALQAISLRVLQTALLNATDAHVQFYLAQLIHVLKPYAERMNLKEFRPGGLPYLANQLHLELVEVEKRRNLFADKEPTYRNQLVLHECVLGIQRVWRAYTIRKNFLAWRHHRHVEKGLVHLRAWAYFLGHFYHRVLRFRYSKALVEAETKARQVLSEQCRQGVVEMIRTMDRSMMRYEAAMKLQRLWRQYKARLDVCKRREEWAVELRAGRHIAWWWRSILQKQQRRQQYQVLLKRRDVLMDLQRVGRGYLARRWLGFHFLQTISHDAANNIQRVYRGWKVRREYAKLCEMKDEKEKHRQQAAYNIQRVWRGHCVRRDLQILLRGREQNAVALIYQAEEHRRAAENARKEAEKRERLALEAERLAREQKVLLAMEREAQEATQLRLQVKAEKARLAQLKLEAELEEQRIKAMREAAEAEVEEMRGRRDATEKELNEWKAKRQRQERRAAERAAAQLEKEKATVLRLQEAARKKREEELQWEMEELSRQEDLVRNSRRQLEAMHKLEEERRRLQDEAERIKQDKILLAQQQQEREFARRVAATISIQRVWRGSRGRIVAAQQRQARHLLLAHCAAQIQAVWRGVLTRTRLVELRNACMRLQRLWRGWLGRRRAEMVQHQHEWRRGAARQLVRAWRRYKQRSLLACPNTKSPIELSVASPVVNDVAVGPTVSFKKQHGTAAVNGLPPASPSVGGLSTSAIAVDTEPSCPAVDHSFAKLQEAPKIQPQPGPSLSSKKSAASPVSVASEVPSNMFNTSPASPFAWMQASQSLKLDAELPPVFAPQQWARKRPKSAQRLFTDGRRQSLERLLAPRLAPVDIFAKTLPVNSSPAALMKEAIPPSIFSQSLPERRLPALIEAPKSSPPVKPPQSSTVGHADGYALLLLKAQQQQYQQMMQVLQKQRELANLQQTLHEDEQRFQKMRQEKMRAREKHVHQAHLADSVPLAFSETAPQPSPRRPPSAKRPASGSKRPGSSKLRPPRPSSAKPQLTLTGGVLRDLVLRESYSRQEIEWEAERLWCGLLRTIFSQQRLPQWRPGSAKSAQLHQKADAVQCAAP